MPGGYREALPVGGGRHPTLVVVAPSPQLRSLLSSSRRHAFPTEKVACRNQPNNRVMRLPDNSSSP